MITATKKAVRPEVKKYLPVHLLLQLLLLFSHAVAADTLRLDMHVWAGVTEGQIRDGVLVASGRVVYQDPHRGFNVESKTIGQSSDAGHYLLIGKQNAQHTLRVRMEADGLQNAAKGSGKRVINTTSNIAVFNLVADGDQMLAADDYRLEMMVEALPPAFP